MGALRVYFPRAPGRGAPPAMFPASDLFIGAPLSLRASWYLDDVSGAEDWRCSRDLAPSVVQAALSPRSMLATGLRGKWRPPSYVLP
ncbi:hypothetical protein NDU88_003011 [Pleurodeles waltl]|uniref:Uncharacterized protein n=1 Tax=Pleurodeles waltl TaxID=8319 RepID=A0AAV7TPA8_PLEWA|nr:hypothetical protein NDU88_003011 [Pleurodeles waltl]